jgi:hypothetical protein
MAGLVPGHPRLACETQKRKTWMPAQASLRSLRTLGCERGHDEPKPYGPTITRFAIGPHLRTSLAM